MDKKRKKRMVIISLGLLGVFALSALAVGCGRSMHRHGDPEKIRKYAMWKINDKLDDLDATDYQRKAVVGAAENIMADFMNLKEKGEGKSRKLQIISELERGQPNTAQYHLLIDKKLDGFRDFAHRAMDQAMKAFMTLDEDQRKELLEEVREHIEDHHS